MNVIINTCVTFTVLKIITIIITHELEMASGSYNSSALEDSFISLKQKIMNSPLVKYKIPLSAMGHWSVSMSFLPFQIINVDEIQQTVEIASLVLLYWNSTQLSWDPKDYGNLDSLQIDSDSVWIPNVAMPKGSESSFIVIPKTIKIHPLYFIAHMPTTIKTTCDLDLSYFPFDSHNCSIIFIEMEGYSIQTKPYQDKFTSALLHSFFTNTEWIFQNSSCKSSMGSATEPPYAECWITFKRRDFFYVISVVVPLFLIGALTLFVFLIPPESGEKISYVISLFVSMTIFISYVHEIIPRSMNEIPLIVSLIGVLLLKIVMAILATCLVIHRYYTQLKRDENLEKNRNAIKGSALTSETNYAEMKDGGRNRNNAIQLQQSETVSYEKNKNLAFHGDVQNDLDNSETDTRRAHAPILNHHRKPLVKAIITNVYDWCVNVSSSELDFIFFGIFLLASVGTYWYMLAQ